MIYAVYQVRKENGFKALVALFLNEHDAKGFYADQLEWLYSENSKYELHIEQVDDEGFFKTLDIIRKNAEEVS